MLHRRILAALCALVFVGCGGKSTPVPPSLPQIPPADPPPPSCGTGGLMQSLGKTNLLVGYSGDDAVASQAPFDLRYHYLTGPDMSDLDPPCTNYRWWGCWENGSFVQNFIADAKQNGEIPMFTYYMMVTAVGDGHGEVTQAIPDVAFMIRYFADFRRFLSRIGNDLALVHIEPDFWGYGGQVAVEGGVGAHQISAAVASANTECARFENSIAGLGQCMIAMVRHYAPNAKVGLHASSWGTDRNVLLNVSPTFDVAAEGRKLGQFLTDCGAGASDFVVADMSDRDAGYYQSNGKNTWWNTDATLPNFTQAFKWAKAVADTVGRPILWWQIPVGNMSQNDTPNHWKDNRVDTLLTSPHPSDLAASGAIGIAFGAGQDDQTNPSTDGGNLIAKTKAYATAGGAPVCP